MIWSDLYPRIRIHVPGCPDLIIETMLRQVAIEFCRETKIWEETLTAVYPVPGITRYSLDLPEGTKLISIVSTKQGKTDSYDGIDLSPTVNVFGLMTFEDEPDPTNGSIEVRAILQPSETATEIPDRIGLHYDTALIHGCIALLQSMPAKDWTNLQAIAYHENIYNDRLSEAYVERATQGNEQPLRVKPFTEF